MNTDQNDNKLFEPNNATNKGGIIGMGSWFSIKGEVLQKSIKVKHRVFLTKSNKVSR